MNREAVKRIIERAKRERKKGNYQIYNRYTQELGLVCESSVEYQDACKAIADILRV